ncbi:MAG: peptidyl-prolyl cis-trans isomerase [Candidatus Omnitrophica bacterium]|nr:peptidyl-prolyl cis-trans isomerase [Candidatus Omnitrophota bacterium]
MSPLLKVLRISILALFLLCFLTKSAPALEDAIIGVVNNEVITLKDLRDYIHSAYVTMVTQGEDQDKIKEVMDDLKQNGIQKLIEDKLILSKANQIQMTINPKAIDDRIEDLKKRYGSEDNLINALIENRASLTELRKKITDQLKIQYVIEDQVKSKVFVNPEEVTKFYKDNQDKFKREPKVNVQSIFLSFDKRNKTVIQELAQSALTRLKNGEKFEDVAKDISDAPSLGIIEKGKFLPAIENVLFALNVNEVSNPIEVETGVYVFKVTGKFPAQIASLQDVKNDVEKLLYKIKFKEKLVEWIEKLKKDAYIEIK